MKEKILYISDRPTMGADMLIKKLSDTFEITRLRSSDEIKYVPKFILVNLAGLESYEKLISLTNTRIYLLGTQAEVESINNNIPGAEAFIRPFNANEIRDKLAEISQDAKDFRRMILLVDDDSIMIRTLREGLSTSYKVLPSSSGADALKILERFEPDMILLDYEMPGMNGPKVLGAVRDNPRTAKIPVMFLTAKSDLLSVAMIEKLKPEGYLLKTMPLKEIKEIIQDFFDNI